MTSTPPSYTSVPEEEHIRVLVSIEYCGVNYGGFQRQALHNKINFPSIQGTLEDAATVVCHRLAQHLQVDPVQLLPQITKDDTSAHPPTSPRALLVMSSGRTDRAVHSLQHMCLLRLPFSIHQMDKLEHFLNSNQPTSFQQALNKELPHDIHVYNCQILSRQEQRQLRFPRKQYTYLIHQQTNPQQPNQPWPPWQDYSYYVHHPLDITKMQRALALMVGTHDFWSLSCETQKTKTVRTIHEASLTVLTQTEWKTQLPSFRSSEKDALFSPPHYGRRRYEVQHEHLQQQQQRTEKDNNDAQQATGKRRRNKLKGHAKAANKGQMDRLDPSTYQIIQITMQGNGFLRHQVRRMVSVLLKIGQGKWEPEIVTHILENEPDFIKKQSVALAPGRALWKQRVWTEIGNGRQSSPIAIDGDGTEKIADDGPQHKRPKHTSNLGIK